MDTEQNEAAAKRRFKEFSKDLMELQTARRKEAEACGELDAEVQAETVLLAAVTNCLLSEFSPVVRLEIEIAAASQARSKLAERSDQPEVTP